MTRRERGANALPEMPMMVDDWLGSQNIILMGRAAEGCFIRLLLYQWRDGSIPADATSLSVLCMMPMEEFRAVWDRLSGEFPVCEDDPTRRANRRGLMIRTQAEDKVRARSEAARAAVEAREGRRRPTGPTQLAVIEVSDDRSMIERSSNDDRTIIHPLPLPQPEELELELTHEDDLDRPVRKSRDLRLTDFLPPEFGTPELIAAWDDFCAYRRERRDKPYTSVGLRQLAGKLTRYGWDAESAAELIGMTMASNWQGPPHDKLVRGPVPNVAPHGGRAGNGHRARTAAGSRPRGETSSEMQERLKRERASRLGIVTVEATDAIA